MSLSSASQQTPVLGFSRGLSRRWATVEPLCGRITILVSHRFSTVRMADFIVVLDGARVVESGTHEALLAKGGQYAEAIPHPGRGLSLSATARWPKVLDEPLLPLMISIPAKSRNWAARPRLRELARRKTGFTMRQRCEKNEHTEGEGRSSGPEKARRKGNQED